MKILIINSGSSSLKYQLFNTDTEEILAKGLCERIGIDGRLKHNVPGKDAYEANIPMTTHLDAIKAVIDVLTNGEYAVVGDLSEINAIGHRVLHGGSKFSGSVLVDDKVIDAIRECIPLGPLHNPANLMGIEACRELMPNTPNVAVFDTAFHATIPDYAYMYAVPYEDYEQYGIRKYGFHGTSHRFVSKQVAKYMNKPAEELKIITCHIGNGSSIAAVLNGKCVDTTMGLTPLDGLPMGTRTGSIDPAIVGLLMEKKGFTTKEVDNYLNKKSGMLGVSGVSSDFRDLTAAINEGNQRALLAVKMLSYSIKRYIGAYTAAMNGVDAIVFTAGVGENSIHTRHEVLDGLKVLGIEIDEVANNVRGEEKLITTENSSIPCYIIPTNEELMIARDTYDLSK